jgi:hypothetical protein
MTWRNLYNSCLCELDPTRLTELIYDTEHAMLSRCRELPADDDAERFEINDALEVLLILKQKATGLATSLSRLFSKRQRIGLGPDGAGA